MSTDQVIRVSVVVIGTILLTMLAGVTLASTTQQVTVMSDGWELIGDLQLPEKEGRLPVVLMLNKADGNRHVYQEMANHLADRGIASLRLDMRGHGDSINLDQFVPDKSDEAARQIMIWDSEADVIAAHEFLKAHARFDADRVAVIGGSYSGEEMAEAGRIDHPLSVSSRMRITHTIASLPGCFRLCSRTSRTKPSSSKLRWSSISRNWSSVSFSFRNRSAGTASRTSLPRRLDDRAVEAVC